MTYNSIAIRTVEGSILASITIPHQPFSPNPQPVEDLEGQGDTISEALYDLADQLESIGE